MPELTRFGVGEEVAIPVTAKNVERVRLDLYPIDLLVYFSLQKDVEKIAELNLDGLPAAKSVDLELGDILPIEVDDSASNGDLGIGRDGSFHTGSPSLGII